MNEDRKVEKLGKLYQKKLGRPLDAEGYRSFQSSGFDLDAARKEVLAMSETKPREKVSQSEARKLHASLKDKYTEKYTKENFVSEYKSVTGKDPDQKTISRWLSDGIGVGQFRDQYNYESKNVKVLYFDKHGLPILRNTQERPASIVKIHTNADAYRQFYGDGKNYIGEDRRGTVQVLPTSVVQDTQDRKTLTQFSKAGENQGLASLIRKQGLNPESFSFASSTRPVESKGFLEMDVGHQIDRVLGGNFASKVGDTLFDKWMPNELKYLADPAGVMGSFIEEDANRDAVKGGSNLFNTEEKNIYKAQGYMNQAANLLLTLYGYGWAGGLKDALRGQTMRIGGQVTEDQRDAMVSSGLKNAAISYAAGELTSGWGDYVKGMNAGATTTAALNYGGNYAINTGAGVAAGQSLGDAATEAAWSSAARGTYNLSNAARVLVDGDYRERIQNNPVSAAGFALSIGTGLFGTPKALGGQTDAQGNALGGYFDTRASLQSAGKPYGPMNVFGQRLGLSTDGKADWSGPKGDWSSLGSYTRDYFVDAAKGFVKTITGDEPWQLLNTRGDSKPEDVLSTGITR